MANTDTSEIEKFNTLGYEDWWSETGACSALHALNPLRLAFIEQHINIGLKDQHILDIGCGGGILCEALAVQGGIVTGIDLSPAVLEIAKKHLSDHHNLKNNLNIHYTLSSAEDYAEQCPGQFDIITCMEMLEHVPDPAGIILAAEKLLKPNGKIFLSTLNRNIKSYLSAIIGAEWILKLLPKLTHDYAKFIRPAELNQMLRQAGFAVKDMQGISYRFLNKQYYLSADISVNYLLYAQKKSSQI